MSNYDRDAFVLALLDNEDDTSTRLVYADWLDENGENEEADRMRKWPAAKAWMLEWVKSINYEDCDYNEETGEEIRKGTFSGPHSYGDAIEAGYDLVCGEGARFGSDQGADYFRESVENCREFLRNWSILTGVAVSDEVVKNSRGNVGCAC